MSKVLVLCYHALSESWPAPLVVTPARFAEQLHHLAELGYRGATFSAAVAAPSSERLVAVTFDDGYTSVLEHGEPVLRELGWPATVFVATDFIDTNRPVAWAGMADWLAGAHRHELATLGWSQLRNLQEAGWEVGSHTCSHPLLPRLDDDRLSRELLESKAVCDRELGGSRRTVAYPYGGVDRRVAAAARRARYAAGAGLPSGRRKDDRFAWARVGVYRDDTLERFQRKVSPVTRAIQASSVYGAWRSISARPGRDGSS